ncbi:T9SS type A sorting domain-containing protein [Aquimarina sp. 2304DJ70-9]|uniref:T9SS type A sorting domain-containing protein n=1 Tax=Aquimarina penaris TaxID=3231044 RepID=UPI003462581D
MVRKLLSALFFILFYTSTFAQLFTTDVIVQGSMQVGLDAQNGYNFGSDTFVMSENNLRMYFDDTSASASFPNNDWRFTFNDQTNGGGNYFSIDDATGGTKPFRVDAGAPNNAFRISSDGNIGIGTDNPGSIELNIFDNDTPTIRLAQNGGFGVQSWDVAANEANFFVRDVTNGSKLPFRIQPNTPKNTLTLRSSGTVGVGTWGPNSNASVHMSSTSKGLLINRLNTDQRTTFAASLGTGENGMMVYDNEENKLYLWNGTAWITDTDAQDLELTDNTLSLANDATTVDLAKYLDNTDDQTIDVFQLNGNNLELSLESDGVATQTVDLSAYVNTDTQDLTLASLSGTELTIEIENGNGVTVDLSSILDPLQQENEAQQVQIDDLLSRLEALEQNIVSQIPINKSNVPILYQNIPNPFNGTSTIKYYLPEGITSASIVFSDMLGKVFSTVSLKETGDSDLNVNSDGLANGTYFYTLYIGSRRIDTKKMVVKN